VLEQVVAQAAELSAKLVRTINRAMRNLLEIIVLSSSPTEISENGKRMATQQRKEV
jgi:hypothetical protein